MRSALRGKRILSVEVTNVSPHGFWLFIHEREVFVSFKEFPWFREASIAQLTNLELPSPHHLYWPDLDIDLAVESLDHPEKYPLISRARPKRLERTIGARRRGRAQGSPGRAAARR